MHAPGALPMPGVSAPGSSFRGQNQPRGTHIDELELTTGDQGLGDVAPVVRLLVPPAGEEAGLDVDEVALRVLDELVDDCVHDVVDLREEVLVDGHLPARVVVRVRHQVDAAHAAQGADQRGADQRGADQRGWLRRRCLAEGGMRRT